MKQVYLGGKQEEAKEEKTDTLKHEVPEVNEEVSCSLLLTTTCINMYSRKTIHIGFDIKP